jgi:hypothetical protein
VREAGIKPGDATLQFGVTQLSHHIHTEPLNIDDSQDLLNVLELSIDKLNKVK